MQNLDKLKDILATPKKIVITTHQKPDADALGSSLGLWNYLQLLGHEATVITPTDYPEFLNWMYGNSEVLVFNEKTPKKAVQLIEQAELIFCLDFSDLKRCSPLDKYIEKTTCTKVLIDHHIGYNGFADFALWDTKAAAASQLIFEFIDLMGHKDLINTHIADCIYAGIMTDTGSFRFASTTSQVHRIVAQLIDIGTDTALIHDYIYDNQSEERTRFLGYALKEKMVVLPQYKTAYFVISQSELKRYNHRTGDTEGLVNYGLSIKGIRMAVTMIEKEDCIRMSFRSFGNLSVNQLAEKYFQGGGHKNAAGGRSDTSLKETEQKLREVLELHKDELNA